MSAHVLWLGHASALVSLGGQRVLIDPLGRRRCAGLPPADAILITHAHVDHLNRWTLGALDRNARVIVPRGARKYVEDMEFAAVTEVSAGDAVRLGEVEICAVPTRHERGRWWTAVSPECCGYILRWGGTAIHHAGDIDMSDSDVFREIGRTFEIDAALLPIGGMLPTWYYRARRKALDRGVHIDPDTALRIADELHTKYMIPVHWGTVNLRIGSREAPRKRLLEVAAATSRDDGVRLLAHGETLTLGDE